MHSRPTICGLDIACWKKRFESQIKCLESQGRLVGSLAKRFFILGCQRTGTTLMRLVLEAHPEVFCWDELKAYAVLQQRLGEDHLDVKLVGFKLPRWTEQLLVPSLLDDGPEGPCKNFYRGEKILFLRRDVRDTIASMLKLRAGESNWCAIWVPRILEAKLVNDHSFRDRYAVELAVIEQNPERRLVGLAALYWKYKTEAFFQYQAQGLPVLAVPYERLVTEPRVTLQSVCVHLDIPFHENLLRHDQLPHGELVANGLAIGNTDPKKPIQADSVGQWDRFLTPGDVALIGSICGQLAA